MALRLREDEEFLSQQSNFEILPTVEILKAMPKAQRSRCLDAFLKKSGVPEPEDAHISLAETLVFSDKPSARAAFPGGVTIARSYDRLEKVEQAGAMEAMALPCPGELCLPGLRVTCAVATELVNAPDAFTVHPVGSITVTSRQSGDEIRLPGGSKSLKKLFIDRKIPAAQRLRIPVVRDDAGVLGVYSIGVHQDRAAAQLPAVTIRFEKTENKGE